MPRLLAASVLLCAIILSGCGSSSSGVDGSKGASAAKTRADQKAYIDGFSESYAAATLQSLRQDQSDAICERASAGNPNCPAKVTEADVVDEPAYRTFLTCARRATRDVEAAPKARWKAQANKVAEGCSDTLYADSF